MLESLFNFLSFDDEILPKEKSYKKNLQWVRLINVDVGVGEGGNLWGQEAK